MTQELHQAIADLLTTTGKTDLTLREFTVKAEAIKEKHDPVKSARRQFNNWRSSDEGRTWKLQKFESTGGACPECLKHFPTIGCFHIDHIKPLSKHPALTTELSNLQLLCGQCNLSKGATNS